MMSKLPPGGGQGIAPQELPDMNRKILIQVATPTVLIGLLLLGACLVSAWYVNRLQTNIARILSENVTSQEAAQKLEIEVRRLRLHSLLNLMDPSPSRHQAIEKDHEHFEKALDRARQAVSTPQEKRCIQDIEAGYRRYRADLELLLASGVKDASRSDLAQLADSHPVLHVTEPAQELLTLNKEAMAQIAEESLTVSWRARITLILVGLVGPLGGLIVGNGIARALSRSIFRLGVHVQDMAQRLDHDVASVRIEANGDLQDLDRQLEYVVRRVEEVTERQQQHQREMLRAEQLSAVGQLAASVAHEVRNPLTAVKMLVEVALRSRSRKPLSLDDLEVIHREVARLEQTVQGFLDFARLPAPHRTQCDLRTVLAEAVDLVRARAKQQNVEVAVSQPESKVEANVDRSQLGTVLVNLFLNALDAMPNGGRLETVLESSPTTGITLTVHDTGAGISAEIAPRLFTPFTSSKATGTGLGLSISRRILEEHGGRLTGANRPEGGACFTLSLPVTSGPEQTAGTLARKTIRK
jgi:signal transduction histidine kinase